MGITFAEGALIVGLLLALTAGLSGFTHGTVLSISVLSVLGGVVLAAGDVVDVAPQEHVVVYTVEIALIITLFADGMLAEAELLRHHWRPPARALAIAMPITLAMLALVAKALFPDLSWSESFLLGAVLSPTDPVVTSAVVTATRVPRIIRHTLNLESGLNDGLALPFVLFFLVLATKTSGAGHEALSLLGEALAGAALGTALAFAAGLVLPLLPGGITHKYEGVYALGLSFVAFGVAEETYGNGLIAAFVAGIALTLVRHEMPEAFSDFNESVSATFQVITFFLFGALIVTSGYHGSIWKLSLFVAFALFVARPAAVLLSFLGIDLPMSHKLFMAWFGPKGVASMLFALLVLGSTASHRAIVFDVASYTVLASIVAHGLTDTVGASWIERRMERANRRQEPAGARS